MKRIIFWIILLSLLVWGFKQGSFVYQNFRGIGPAVRPPSGNIATILETTPKQAVNTTGLPLTLLPGFSIHIFAKNLGVARVLAWDPQGTLLVSIPSQGKVVALPDRNGDGVADETRTVLTGLDKPHGLAFRDGKLYVAQTGEVDVYAYDPAAFRATDKKNLFDLPANGIHYTRTIGFGPDGRLYVSVGSDCNVCVEKDPRRTKILVANPDGTDLKEFASGLRNTVFFTWHPTTHELWGNDMGRDLLGDDIPPDEINILKEGKFYGWPYCYGKNIVDREFDTGTGAAEKM